MFALTINPAFPGIRVKSVSLPEDSNELINLLKEEFYHPAWTIEPSREEVEQSYKLLNAGNASGAWFLQYNARTVFLLEILPVEETDNDDLYRARPGDFFIRIIPGPDDDSSHAADTLKACNEAILQNPLVKRILCPVKHPVPETALRDLLETVGFTILQREKDRTRQMMYSYS